MLNTNLSTRPFYNARAVQLLLGALGLAVFVLTIFNVVQIVRLSSQQRTLGASAADAERQAAQLRNEAVALRGRTDPREVALVAGEAREANTIIDQRTFSWTTLFMYFEQTLPDDVRVTAVAPRIENGVFRLDIQVEGRRVEDIDAFIEALEGTGRFSHVLPNQEQPNDAGLLEAVLDATYLPEGSAP